MTKQQDRFIWFIAVLPLVLAGLNAAWTYTAPGIDAWIYYGYFFNFQNYNQFFPDAYFGDRLTWIIPGYILNELFSPVLANFILRLIVYYTAIFSLYFVLKMTFNRRIGLLGVALMGAYLPFLGAVGWNYMDGIGMAYMLLSMFLLTLAARSSHPSRWRIWMILAGVSYAALVFTNLVLLLFAPFLGSYYFFVNYQNRKNPIVSSVIYTLIGGLALTCLLGMISLATGSDFLFFWSSVKFALEGSNETGNAIAVVSFSELKGAHHLALLIVSLIGGVWLLLRHGKKWREHPYAVFFQVYLIGITLFFVLLEAAAIHVLYLFYYANYLMPAIFIAIAAQVAVFTPLSTLTRRQFAALILGGIGLLGLPLVLRQWRDLSLSYDEGDTAILLTCLAVLLGFAFVVFKRPAMLALLFLSLSLVSYRIVALPTVTSNPPTDLEGDDKAFLLAIHDGIRAVQKVAGDDPMYFWYPNAQPYYALASAHVNPDSFIGRPFPQIYPWVTLQEGMKVAILSEPSDPQAIFETARQTLNKRLFNAEYLSAASIPYEDTSIDITFIQIQGCSTELGEDYQTYKDNFPFADLADLNAVIFYPAQDYATQWKNFPAQHDCLVRDDEKDEHFNLITIFEQAKDEDTLSLNDEQLEALAEWRNDKQPIHLQKAGIKFLLLTSEWTGWLSADEQAIFQDNTLYTLVNQWRFEDVEMTYSLYQIVEN